MTTQEISSSIEIIKNEIFDLMQNLPALGVFLTGRADVTFQNCNLEDLDKLCLKFEEIVGIAPPSEIVEAAKQNILQKLKEIKQ